MRLSESEFDLPESPGLTPSFAMKFLRSGMRSVNLLTLANEQFTPSDNFNFFSGNFNTRLSFFKDECAKKTIQRKFLQATERVQSLGNAELSKHNVDGTRVRDIDMVFPFNIEFRPVSAIKDRFSHEREFDQNGEEIKWYDQLIDRIEPNDILFEVYARDVPEDEDKFGPSTVKHIANIRQTDKQIKSNFGDTRLFFQHELMRIDLNRKPEWVDYVPRLDRDDPVYGKWDDPPMPDFPEDDETAKAWLRGSIADQGCPFAWLLKMDFNPIF